MTTPSTARKAGPLLGNGSTTAFPFTFKVFAAADVAVTIANSSGVETPLVLNTDYSVTLNGNQDTSPGGTITYPISGAALPSGSKLSIVGDIDYDQPLDLPSGGNFSPLALENQLDRATMQIQQLAEGLSRAAKLPVTNSEDPATLVADIVRLADSADNIDTLVANLADITTVADDLNEPVSEINTVAGAITNVNNVGNNITNVNTVAGISANVTTVAAIDDDVTAVAGVAANVTTVASVSAAVTAVAAIDDDVTIAAANVADITNFADVYQGPKTSDPTLRNDGSALQVGDLYFNTVEQALRTYGGTQWVSGTAGTVAVQNFSGNASTTAFTLATAPAGENNTQVYIGGVYQQKDQYSVSGTTLTFSTAPPTGTNNIEVVTISTLAIGETDASLVSFLPAGTGAVERTAQAKLRDAVSVFDFMTAAQIADVQGYTAAIDVTSALHAARDAAYGKTLYFPAGKYRHAGIGIDPNKPCRFVGDGYGPSGNYGTILYNVGSSHSIGIQNTGPGNDVMHVFEDMMIVGTSSSTYGIWGENEHGIRANKLWITGHGRHGVYLTDGWSNKFEHCVITHNQHAGVVLLNRCNNVTFDKCVINGNDDSGLGYSNVQMNANAGLENLNVNLINCDISYVGSTTGFCLLVLGTYGLNVTGCYLEGGLANTKLVYVATNTKSCEFKSNYFQDGLITAETGTDIRFIGNIIHKQYHTTTLTLNNPGGTEYVSENNSFTGGATPSYSNGAGSLVEGYKNSPPTVGTWEAGSVIYRTYFAGGANQGWTCVTGGTPGTWVPFGIVPAAYANHGDAGATLTYFSSYPTNLWQSPLTANRTVTLSATNATSGAKFRVTRTSGATGAFTLDVGGLKSLSVGQWCDVEHDGSAWRLTAFGSL